MSEFDEALAQAVEDGVARGGLPGVADAVRRGRRRSLRARGGAAVLGVAAVGGAFGVTAALGGTAGGGNTTAAAVATTATTPAPAGHSASAPTPAPGADRAGRSGDGLLAANLWPGYDEYRWNPVQATPAGGTAATISVVLDCAPPWSKGPAPETFPTIGISTWATAHSLASESVFTFADEAKASAYLADVRKAGSAPACRPGSGADGHIPSPGVSTGYGVSWQMGNRQAPGSDGLPSGEHDWAVQVGNRVALLRVNWVGPKDASTADDAKVLANLQQALQK